MAGAVGFSVIDKRMVIDVLPVAGEVQTIERTFAALGVEDSVGFIATRLPPKVMLCERKLLRLVLDLQSFDVEGAFAFALHFVMIDDGAGSQHHFGDGVGEINILSQTNIILHDLRLAMGIRQDKGARIRYRWFAAASRNIKELDRLLNDGVFRQMNEGTVHGESGVQGRKRLFLVASVARQVRLYRPSICPKHVSQAANVYAGRQRGHGR